MPISLLRRPEAIVVVALLLAMIGIGFVNPAFWSLDNQFGLGTFEAQAGPQTLVRLDPFPEFGHALSQPIGTRTCNDEMGRLTEGRSEGRPCTSICFGAQITTRPAM